MMISRSEIGKVYRGYVQSVSGVRKGEGRKPAGEASGVRQADALTLSAEAQEVQRLREALAAVPEVREERVRALAERVASGTYRVDADEVATQILGRLLGDQLG